MSDVETASARARRVAAADGIVAGIVAVIAVERVLAAPLGLRRRAAIVVGVGGAIVGAITIFTVASASNVPERLKTFGLLQGIGTITAAIALLAWAAGQVWLTYVAAAAAFITFQMRKRQLR
jgi:hypothetical protein